jgi:hypothetical protein
MIGAGGWAGFLPPSLSGFIRVSVLEVLGGDCLPGFWGAGASHLPPHTSHTHLTHTHTLNMPGPGGSQGGLPDTSPSLPLPRRFQTGAWNVLPPHPIPPWWVFLFLPAWVGGWR